MVKRGRGRPKKIAVDNSNNDGGQAKTMRFDGKVSNFDDDVLPEFFKIYAPSISSERMRIPQEFSNNFDGNMPTFVTLRRALRSGQSWQVNISKSDGHWYLEGGWQKFVQENSVGDGDFLNFCYSGNSIFCVKIFARNGCIKIADDDSRSRPIESYQQEGNYEASHERPKAYEEDSKICTYSPRIRRKGPMGKQSVRGNPCFSKTMTKTYVIKRCNLYLPKDFCDMYTREEGSSSRMVTLWINKKSWHVALTACRFDDRLQFQRGWSNFVKDNSLKIGNLCTFELIDRIHLAFEVTIS